MSLLNKKQSFIGIDIGSSAIKLMQIELQGSDRFAPNAYRLMVADTAVLPPETVVEGAVMNTVAVVDAIKGLVAKHNIQTKNAVIALSGNSVIIKPIRLQLMSMDELEEQIKWEAEQYIPFDINDCNIDVQILHGAETDPSEMDVLLVAARKDVINEYRSLIQQAGLNAQVVDIASFALANTFKLNYPMEMEEGVVALVNVGEASTNIHILRGGVSVFTRDLGIGGRVLTDALHRDLMISVEEAEQLKVEMSNGVFGQDGSELTLDNIDQNEVSSILKNAADTIASEVQRSLDYYLQMDGDGYISSLYLSGGSAAASGLESSLGELTGIPIERMDPFRGVVIDEREFQSGYMDSSAGQFAVVTGLAMRTDSLNDQESLVAINLKQKKYNRRQQAIIDEVQKIGFYAVMLIIILALFQVLVGMQEGSIEDDNRLLQQEINKQDAQVKEVQALKLEKKSLEEKLEAIDKLKQAKRGPVLMLDELARACPEKLRILELTETAGRIKISGTAASGPEISKFMQNLKRSPIFTDLLPNTIVQVEEDGINVMSFSITARLVVDKKAEEEEAEKEQKK